MHAVGPLGIHHHALLELRGCRTGSDLSDIECIRIPYHEVIVLLRLLLGNKASRHRLLL